MHPSLRSTHAQILDDAGAAVRRRRPAAWWNHQSSGRRGAAQPLAERLLVDLARRGLGQIVDDLPRRRHLDPREALARVALDVGEVGALGEDDDGMAPLAAALVGPPDAGRRLHRGMLGERVLDLAGIDVLTA